jgi:hypothetical protein
MLFREIVAVYFPEDGIKYMNTFCDYNVEFYMLKKVGMGFCLKQRNFK